MNSNRGHFLMLGAVVLVLLSVQASNAKDDAARERVIAEVTRLGGKVEFDEILAAKPIVKIDLHSTQITNDDLGFLERDRKALANLRYLDLRLTKIGDAGVAKLKNLKSLQTLNLFRSQLTDVGLTNLKKMTQLETLLIGGTKVSDVGLPSLRPLKKLKKLSLFQTQVSDQGIAQLKLLTSLEVLLITGSKITPAGAEALQKALPKVRFSENT
ncbi:MAG TPA: hypothetical protein VLL54_13515 [Pyrinomonadaceae bacterium]|nr:hypothetical protein [Pyrinomonadaceae bacterium]